MVKHQPQLAAAAQRAAAMMATTDATGAIAASSHVGTGKTPPPKVLAAVNGETKSLSEADCDLSATDVDGPVTAVIEGREMVKEDC